MNIFDEPKLPIIYSNFSVYGYFRTMFDVNFDSQVMEMQYDPEPIIKKLIENPNFDTIASKHVAVIVNDKSQYLHFADQVWNPYRETVIPEDPSTVEDILLSENDNLVKKMSKDMASNDEITQELIRILNLQPIEENPSVQNNAILSNKVITETSDFQKNKLSFIDGPTLNIKEETIDIDKLKNEAFKVLASHPDRTMVKNIVLNGATYGIPKPNLTKIRDHYTPKSGYISILANNWYGLWDEFSEDPKIKTFLLNVIEKIEDENLKATIAYKYKLFTHPSIHNHIQEFFTDKYTVLDYYRYTEGDINISKLPIEAIRPFENQFLEILNKFESVGDDKLDRSTKEMIVPICDMLHKLGHEKFPEKLLDKVNAAKRNNEQYDDNFFEDDDYESEETFLLRMYRKIQVKNILYKFDPAEENPIWDIDLPPEPYKKSWYNTLDLLLAKGEEIYGVDFRNVFIQKLSDNIAKDECYDHDRLMAFNFIHYTYKHIQKRPELASLAEKIVTAIQQNKEKFSEEIDLYNIKEKSKYALLQAAWNDLKNEDWDLAEKKSNAIIQIDPQLGQVYFLQARLLWLKEGIPAYLAQKDEFIKKASHDAAALARLYNLTGCALDVEKRYEESLHYFKNAALTATNEPMYLANIAEIYYKLKNPEEALNYVTKAKQNGHSSEMMDEIIQNKGIINLKDAKDEN
ncbi:tetratricopeptide repeat protein [Aquimarina sp. SS2-1]|uniref:tetratricopeptide repeat protein n=1 Tax=Aquimarina besae TaxID=3342247 RepID=UPI0036701751